MLSHSNKINAFVITYTHFFPSSFSSTIPNLSYHFLTQTPDPLQFRFSNKHIIPHFVPSSPASSPS